MSLLLLLHKSGRDIICAMWEDWERLCLMQWGVTKPACSGSDRLYITHHRQPLAFTERQRASERLKLHGSVLSQHSQLSRSAFLPSTSALDDSASPRLGLVWLTSVTETLSFYGVMGNGACCHILRVLKSPDSPFHKVSNLMKSWHWMLSALQKIQSSSLFLSCCLWVYLFI